MNATEATRLAEALTADERIQIITALAEVAERGRADYESGENETVRASLLVLSLRASNVIGAIRHAHPPTSPDAVPAAAGGAPADPSVLKAAARAAREGGAE